MVDDRCIFARDGYYSRGPVDQQLTVPCRGIYPRTGLDDSDNIEGICVYGDKEIWQSKGKNLFS